tara:strand:+ start:355 stop:672 length:318 start_codon:yes stop_codon:yes gene_type:complete
VSIYKTVTVPEQEVEVEVDLDESELLEAVESEGLGIGDFIGYDIFDDDDMAEYLLINDYDLSSVVNSEELDRLKAENERLKGALRNISLVATSAFLDKSLNEGGE